MYGRNFDARGISCCTRSRLTWRCRLSAAKDNGVTRDAIKGVLMQTAIHCSVPMTHSAFHLAQTMFAEQGKKRWLNAGVDFAPPALAAPALPELAGALPCEAPEKARKIRCLRKTQHVGDLRDRQRRIDKAAFRLQQ